MIPVIPLLHSIMEKIGKIMAFIFVLEYKKKISVTTEIHPSTKKKRRMSFVLSRKKERKKNLIGNKSLENERNFFSEVKKKFSKTHLNDYSSFVRSVDTHTHTHIFIRN